MHGAVVLLLLAGAPEILLPPWPLSPDGEPVGVRGGAPLSAEGARVEAIAPGLWRVLPDAGAREVALRAGEARLAAPVAPPPARIEIAATPPAPTKGEDAAATLELAVLGADGAPDPSSPAPLLLASTGAIGEVAPAGPGLFRARYELPETRHPEVAVLLALVPRCPLCPTPRALGHLVLPLPAAIELPGRAEPGVRTRVEVGGRVFGPAVADARGRFSIALVVPPGARFAGATAVDPLGNAKRSTLDLELPEIDRLACAVWPRALPADGQSAASVHCVASGPGGAPAPDAPLELRARLGAVGPFERVRGALQRARYTAPAGGAPAEDALVAAYPAGGAASRDALAIALAAGAPADVRVRLGKDPVPLGAAVPAVADVVDARGDRVGRASGPPGARAGFVSPDRFVARAAGEGWTQEAPLAFALEPGAEAATLALRRAREGWVAEARTVDARPAAGVRVRFGSGAEAVTDARGEARSAAQGSAESVVAANGARAAGWAGIEPPPAPIALTRTVAIALRPPSAIEVVARVDAGAIRWRVETADGAPLPERRVVVRGDGVALGPAERDGAGGRAAVLRGHGPVAVIDAETGVSALVEVP